MKKIYTLSLTLLATVASFAQTIYSENFGTPASNTLVSEYTGYQNTSPIMYSGTATVRTTAASTGYAGVSGSGNVYFGADQTFMVEGINTSAYSTADLVLTFGQSQASASDTPSSNLVLEVSSNGTDFTALPYTRSIATGWELITVDEGIPSATNLRIRFRQTSTIQYRIDDLKLSVIASTCALGLGTETTACGESTVGTNDTFTVTIPFTGGGTATYNIVATTGTIGGDNPSTMTEGNIIVSGIAEGTDVTVTVTGGTCNLSKEVMGVLCKPINTLPYYESFDYTVGSILSDEQMWSSSNSGDNVTIAEGNLNYPGITPDGESVSFSGSGAESYTPFTVTNSGTIYSSFLFSVTDMTNVTEDMTETYFAALTGETTSAYNVRLFLKKVGGQYQIGLASSGNTTTNYTTTSFNVGETVMVIMGFDYATNKLSAWINPTLATFNDATPATLTETLATAPGPDYNYGSFLIRQDNDARTPSITLDELRIGTTLASVTQGTTGVQDNSISGLKVFPNPLNGNVLNITSDNNAVKTVTVFDVLGKQVVNTTTANQSINVNLTSGVYVVKITEEGKTATRKLVVQ